MPGCLLLLRLILLGRVSLTYVTRFLYDAVPISKTGIPRGRLVLVTSPKREKYHVSISPFATDHKRGLEMEIVLKILSLSSIRVGCAQGGTLWQVPHGALGARGT
jgi:hypothetical protein